MWRKEEWIKKLLLSRIMFEEDVAELFLSIKDIFGEGEDFGTIKIVTTSFILQHAQDLHCVREKKKRERSERQDMAKKKNSERSERG